MAFTVSQVITNTVVGDLRLKIVNVTADAATGSFDAGMGNVVAAHYSIKSQATTAVPSNPTGTNVTNPRLVINAGTTGTAIVGTIAMTSCVANDVYTLVIYAKS